MPSSRRQQLIDAVLAGFLGWTLDAFGTQLWNVVDASIARSSSLSQLRPVRA